MGLGGISFGSLLLILLIAILIFGTGRIKDIGHDLGAAIKSFKSGMAGDDSTDTAKKNDNEDKP